MVDVQALLGWSFLGNSVGDYLVAIVFFFAIFLILKVFKFVILKKLKKLTKKSKTDIDDTFMSAVNKIGWPFYVVLSLYLALKYVHVHVVIDRILYYLIIILLTYYVAKVAQHLIVFSARKVAQLQTKDKDAEAPGVIQFMSRVVQVILWVIAIILILDNLGYKVSTLLAGVGIGGLAIAFALQNVLADLFASISIYFDKPFKVGDFIVVGSDSGTVEKIGMKSTRIRTLQGQELVVSNKELTESRINNFKQMETRRVVFKIGVTYDTKSSKLRKVPKMVKDIITKIAHAKPDRVHFKEFADSSLVFEIVYYVETQDYGKYMDIQQRINLAIFTAFQKEGIDMAFPTQTVYVKK